MFEKLVANLLASKLGRFIEDLNADAVKVSLWRGNVVLKNVKLRRSALRDLGLPVYVHHGQVETLTVVIPWTRLRSESVRIELDNMQLCVKSRRPEDWNSEADAAEAHKTKMEKLEAAELALNERLRLAKQQGGADGSAGGGDGDDDSGGSTLERWQLTMANNIHVAITRVSVSFIDDFSTELTEKRFTLCINKLMIQSCADDTWLPKFVERAGDDLRKLVTLGGASLHFSEGGSDRVSKSVLRPFDLVVKAKQVAQASKSTWTVRVTIPALSGVLSRGQWDCARASARFVNSVDDRAAFLALRPACCISKGPQAREWWNYAIQAVITVLRRRSGTKKSRWNLDVYYLQKEYCELYKRALGTQAGRVGTSFLQALSKRERQRMIKLELELPLETIVYSRKMTRQRLLAEEEHVKQIRSAKGGQESEASSPASPDGGASSSSRASSMGYITAAGSAALNATTAVARAGTGVVSWMFGYASSSSAKSDDVDSTLFETVVGDVAAPPENIDELFSTEEAAEVAALSKRMKSAEWADEQRRLMNDMFGETDNVPVSTTTQFFVDINIDRIAVDLTDAEQQASLSEQQQQQRKNSPSTSFGKQKKFTEPLPAASPASSLFASASPTYDSVIATTLETDPAATPRASALAPATPSAYPGLDRGGGGGGGNDDNNNNNNNNNNNYSTFSSFNMEKLSTLIQYDEKAKRWGIDFSIFDFGISSESEDLTVMRTTKTNPNADFVKVAYSSNPEAATFPPASGSPSRYGSSRNLRAQTSPGQQTTSSILERTRAACDINVQPIEVSLVIPWLRRSYAFWQDDIDTVGAIAAVVSTESQQQQSSPGGDDAASLMSGGGDTSMMGMLSASSSASYHMMSGRAATWKGTPPPPPGAVGADGSPPLQHQNTGEFFSTPVPAAMMMTGATSGAAASMNRSASFSQASPLSAGAAAGMNYAAYMRLAEYFDRNRRVTAFTVNLEKVVIIVIDKAVRSKQQNRMSKQNNNDPTTTSTTSSSSTTHPSSSNRPPNLSSILESPQSDRDLIEHLSGETTTTISFSNLSFENDANALSWSMERVCRNPTTAQRDDWSASWRGKVQSMSIDVSWTEFRDAAFYSLLNYHNNNNKMMKHSQQQQHHGVPRAAMMSSSKDNSRITSRLTSPLTGDKPGYYSSSFDAYASSSSTNYTATTGTTYHGRSRRGSQHHGESAHDDEQEVKQQQHEQPLAFTRSCCLLSSVPMALNMKMAHLPPALMPPLFRLPGTQVDVSFPEGEFIFDASEPMALACFMNSVTLLLDFSSDSRGLRAVERASKKALLDSAASAKHSHRQQRDTTSSADATTATSTNGEPQQQEEESKSFMALDEQNAVVLQTLGPFEGLWEGATEAPTPFSFPTFEPWTMNATPASPTENPRLKKEYVLRSIQAKYGAISVMHESRPTYPMVKAKLKQKQFLLSVHPIRGKPGYFGTSLLLLRGGVAQPPGISNDVRLSKATLDQYGIPPLPSVEQLRRCVDKICFKLDAEAAQVNEIQEQLRTYGEDDPLPDALMASSIISQQLRGTLKVAEIACDIVPCKCLTFLHPNRTDAERFKALLERVALEVPPAPPKIPKELMSTVSMCMGMHLDKKFAFRTRRPHFDPTASPPTSANHFTEASPLFVEATGSTSIVFESSWNGSETVLKTSQVELFAQTPAGIDDENGKDNDNNNKFSDNLNSSFTQNWSFGGSSSSHLPGMRKNNNNKNTESASDANNNKNNNKTPVNNLTYNPPTPVMVMGEKQVCATSPSRVRTSALLDEGIHSPIAPGHHHQRHQQQQQQQQQQQHRTGTSKAFSSSSSSTPGTAATKSSLPSSRDAAGVRAPVRFSISSKTTVEMSLSCTGPSKMRLDPSACGMFETIMDVTSTMLSWSLACNDIVCQPWTSEEPVFAASFEQSTSTTTAGASKRVTHNQSMTFDLVHGLELEVYHDARGLVGISSSKLDSMMMNTCLGSGSGGAGAGAGGVGGSKRQAAFAGHPLLGKFTCSKLTGTWKMGETINSTMVSSVNPHLTLAGKSGGPFLCPHPVLLSEQAGGTSRFGSHHHHHQQQQHHHHKPPQHSTNNTNSNLNKNTNTPSGHPRQSTLEFSFDIQYRPPCTSYNTWLSQGTLGAATSGFAYSYSLGMHVQRCCCNYRQTYLWDLLEFVQVCPVMKRMTWLTVRKPIDVHDRYLAQFDSEEDDSEVYNATSFVVSPTFSAKGESHSGAATQEQQPQQETKKPSFFHLMTQQQLKLIDTVLFVSEKDSDMANPAFCVHVPYMEITSDLFSHVRRHFSRPQNGAGMPSSHPSGASSSQQQQDPQQQQQQYHTSTSKHHQRSASKDGKGVGGIHLGSTTFSSSSSYAAASPTRSAEKIFVPPSLPFPFYGSGAAAAAMPANVEREAFLDEFADDVGDPVSTLSIKVKHIRVFEKGASATSGGGGGVGAHHYPHQAPHSNLNTHSSLNDSAYSPSAGSDWFSDSSPSASPRADEDLGDGDGDGSFASTAIFNSFTSATGGGGGLLFNDSFASEATMMASNAANNNNSSSRFHNIADDPAATVRKFGATEGHGLFHTPTWIFTQPERWTPVIDMDQVNMTNYYCLAPMLLDLPLMWMAVDIPHFVSESSSSSLATFLKVIHGVFYEKWAASYTVSSHADNPYVGVLRTLRTPVVANVSKTKSPQRPHHSSSNNGSEPTSAILGFSSHSSSSANYYGFASMGASGEASRNFNNKDQETSIRDHDPAGALPEELSSYKKRSGLSREMILRLLPVHDTAVYCFQFGSICLCAHDEDVSMQDEDAVPLPLVFTAGDVNVTLQWSSRGTMLTETKVGGEINIGIVEPKEPKKDGAQNYQQQQQPQHHHHPTGQQQQSSSSSYQRAGSSQNLSSLRNRHASKVGFGSPTSGTAGSLAHQAAAAATSLHHHQQLQQQHDGEQQHHHQHQKRQRSHANTIKEQRSFLSRKHPNKWVRVLEKRSEGIPRCEARLVTANHIVVAYAWSPVYGVHASYEVGVAHVNLLIDRLFHVKDVLVSLNMRNAFGRFLNWPDYEPGKISGDDGDGGGSGVADEEEEKNNKTPEPQLVDYQTVQTMKLAQLQVSCYHHANSCFTYDDRDARRSRYQSYAASQEGAAGVGGLHPGSSGGPGSAAAAAGGGGGGLYQHSSTAAAAGSTGNLNAAAFEDSVISRARRRGATFHSSAQRGHHVDYSEPFVESKVSNIAFDMYYAPRCNTADMAVALDTVQVLLPHDKPPMEFHSAHMTMSSSSSAVKIPAFSQVPKGVTPIVIDLPPQDRATTFPTRCGNSDDGGVADASGMGGFGDDHHRGETATRASSFSPHSRYAMTSAAAARAQSSTSTTRSRGESFEQTVKRASQCVLFLQYTASENVYFVEAKNVWFIVPTFPVVERLKTLGTELQQSDIAWIGEHREEREYLMKRARDKLLLSNRRVADKAAATRSSSGKTSPPSTRGGTPTDQHPPHHHQETNGRRNMSSSSASASFPTKTSSKQQQQPQQSDQETTKLLYSISIPNVGIVITEDGNLNIAAVATTGPLCSLQVEQVEMSSSDPKYFPKHSNIHHHHHHRAAPSDEAPTIIVMDREDTSKPSGSPSAAGLVFEDEDGHLHRAKVNKSYQQQQQQRRHSASSATDRPSEHRSPDSPTTATATTATTTMVGTRYSVSVIGFFVRMLLSDQIVVEPVSASLRATTFPRHLQLAAQVQSVGVTVDRGHYEILLRTMARYFVTDEKTMVEEHTSKRQSNIANRSTDNLAHPPHYHHQHQHQHHPSLTTNKSFGNYGDAGASDSNLDDQQYDDDNLLLDQTINLESSISALSQTQQLQKTQLQQLQQEQEELRRQQELEEASGYLTVEVAVELTGFHFNVVVLPECTIHVRLGGCSIDFNKVTIASSSSSSSAPPLPSDDSDKKKDVALSVRTLIEGTAENLLVGLHGERPLVNIRAMDQQPISFQSVLSEEDRMITASLGQVSVYLDPQTVEILADFLYEPYRRIVLPKYGISEVLLLEDDVKLDEPLILTSRKLVKISASKKNFIRIDCQGFPIHFLPSLTPVVIIDAGCTLELYNGKVFLYAGVASVDSAVSGGNGAYTVLNQVEVILSEDADAEFDIGQFSENAVGGGGTGSSSGVYGDGGGEENKQDTPNSAGYGSGGGAALPTGSSSYVNRKLQQDIITRIDGAVASIREKDVFSVGLSAALPDSAGLRELCISVGVVLEREVIPLPESKAKIAPPIATTSSSAASSTTASSSTPNPGSRPRSASASRQTKRPTSATREKDSPGAAGGGGGGGGAASQSSSYNKQKYNVPAVAEEVVTRYCIRLNRFTASCRYYEVVAYQHAPKSPHFKNTKHGTGGGGGGGASFSAALLASQQMLRPTVREVDFSTLITPWSLKLLLDETVTRRIVAVSADQGVDVRLRCGDVAVVVEAINSASNAIAQIEQSVGSADPNQSAAQTIQSRAASSSSSSGAASSVLGGDDSVIEVVAPTHYSLATKALVSFPHLGVYLVDDSTSIDMPLIYVSLFGIVAPTLEVSATGTKIGHVQFKMQIEHYSGEAGLWQPLIEKVGLDFAFRATPGDPHSGDESKKEQSRRAGLNFGVIHLHLTPPGIEMLLRASNAFANVLSSSGSNNNHNNISNPGGGSAVAGATTGSSTVGAGSPTSPTVKPAFGFDSHHHDDEDMLDGSRSSRKKTGATTISIKDTTTNNNNNNNNNSIAGNKSGYNNSSFNQQQQSRSTSLFRQYEIRQNLGDIPIHVSFAEDAKGRFPAPFTLYFGETHAFNYPRIDGQEIPVSQHFVLVTVGNSRSIPISIGKVGEVAFQLPPGAATTHVVVDIFLENAQKIVEIRLPIKFENELPFPVELVGVPDGVLAPNSTKHLTCEPLRRRCVIRPSIDGIECGSTHLGLHYSDLNFLYGQVYLASFPIFGAAAKKIVAPTAAASSSLSSASRTRKTGSSLSASSTEQQQQKQHQQQQLGGDVFANFDHDGFNTTLTATTGGGDEHGNDDANSNDNPYHVMNDNDISAMHATSSGGIMFDDDEGAKLSATTSNTTTALQQAQNTDQQQQGNNNNNNKNMKTLQGVLPKTHQKASDLAAQRAVYALLSFSPLKVIRNVGGSSPIPMLQPESVTNAIINNNTNNANKNNMGGATTTQGGAQTLGTTIIPKVELHNTKVRDITVTLQAPFHIQNFTGVPIKVGLYYKQRFTGRHVSQTVKVEGGYTFAHVVTLPIDVEQTVPVTQMSPVHDVYLDLMLTQPTGEVLSRTSGTPVLIRSPASGERAAAIVVNDQRDEALTILIDYKPRLIVLRAAFWIVNHTMHYLQFQFPTLLSSKPCAGVGIDGIPPMCKQPFLAGGVADSSLFPLFNFGGDDLEKRQQSRSKWKIQVRIGRFETPSSGIIWTKWSQPIPMASVVDIADITCPLERPTTEGDAITVSFSNHLVGGVIQDTMLLTFRARWIVLNRSSFDLHIYRGHNEDTGIAGGRQLFPPKKQLSNEAQHQLQVEKEQTGRNRSFSSMHHAAGQQNSAAGGGGGSSADPNNNNNNDNNPAGYKIFTTLKPQSSVPIELCLRNKISDNSIQIECAGSKLDKSKPSGNPLSTLSGSNPLQQEQQHQSHHDPHSQNAAASSGAAATTTAPPKDPSEDVLRSETSPSIPIDHISEYNLNIRYITKSTQLREFVVFRVSIYTRTSVMFVVIDQLKNPPFEVENRTPFLVSVRQETSQQELLLYPYSTRGFVWEHESDPHVLEVELIASRNRKAVTSLDLDPLLVVRRTLRQLKKDILVPGTHQRVFVRTRSKKDTFCISLTQDRRIDAMLTRPYEQLRVDFVMQGLFVLVADTVRDQRRNIALLSLPELFLSFAQGRLAEQGGPPEDVQKIEVSFGSLQLEKWSESSAQSESSETQTNIIMSMLSSPNVKKNSLVLLRRKDRAVPVLHIRYLAVILQPLLITMDDPFLEDVLSFVDRITAAASAASTTAITTSNPSGGVAGGQGSGSGSGGAVGSSVVPNTHHQQYQQQQPHHQQTIIIAGNIINSATIADSIFETTPWSSELTSKPTDESEFMFRTVVIDSMLLDQFVASVTLVRGTDQSGRDPIKERLGVLSVFVQSVDDARFDFHRIQKQNVHGKIWLLGTQLAYYYLARLKNQALNVVHIAVLDTLMRDVVNDLLDGYFTSSKVNIDRTRQVLSRKRDTRFEFGMDDDDPELLMMQAAEQDPMSPGRAAKLLSGAPSSATLAAAAAETEKHGGETSFFASSSSSGGRGAAPPSGGASPSSLPIPLPPAAAAASSMHQRPQPSGQARVVQTEKGFIIIPDLTSGLTNFDVAGKNVSVLGRISRFVRAGSSNEPQRVGGGGGGGGKGPSEKQTICRCKLVSSALKRGQFPRETFGSPWIRVEELAHHAAWDELVIILPSAELRRVGMLIAELHARWRPLSVFTGVSSSPQGPASTLVAIQSEQLRSQAGAESMIGEAGFGCQRCAEVEEMRARRIADAVHAIEQVVRQQQHVEEQQQLRKRELATLEAEADERRESLRLKLASVEELNKKRGRGNNTTSNAWDDDSDTDDSDDVVAKDYAAEDEKHLASLVQIKHMKRQMQLLDAADKEASDRRAAFVLQQLRTVQSPLPHPLKTSLLSWEELCHHASWDEFVSMTNDMELKRCGGLVQQAILGLPRNVLRIEKDLAWAINT